MASAPLRILILEDVPMDAGRVECELRRKARRFSKVVKSAAERR